MRTISARRPGGGFAGMRVVFVTEALTGKASAACGSRFSSFVSVACGLAGSVYGIRPAGLSEFPSALSKPSPRSVGGPSAPYGEHGKAKGGSAQGNNG
jgi:hypothetical protein